MQLEYLMTNKVKFIPEPKNYTIKSRMDTVGRHPRILNVRSRWGRAIELMFWILFPPGYKEK